MLCSVLLPAVVLVAIAIAKNASKSCQDWIVSMLATGKFTGSILTLVPLRASSGRHSHAHHRCGLFVLMLLIAFPERVAGGCPHCFGANPACTLHASSSGTCPYEVVPTTNRAIVSGTSTSTLCLTHCIIPRFLRCFNSGEMSTVTSLARRPAPGTVIAVDTDPSKLPETLSNLRAGLCSKEDVETAFFAKIAVEANEAKNNVLRANMNMLLKLKSVGDDSSSAQEQNGLLTWLLAKVVAFILSGTFITTTVIVGAAGASNGGSVHRAKVPRPTTFAEFGQAMNLYVMYFVALGIGNVMAITQFFQFVVYDTINIRYEDWRTAYELMVLAFRKIEDCSDGAWNLVTVTGEIVMAGMMAEARMAAKYFHPVFFRTRGGAPQPSGGTSDDDSKPDTVTWNGKWSTGNKCKYCPAFNYEHATKKGESSDHTKKHLKECGTCKGKHLCSKWVDDKGAWGRCEGDHPLFKCDNPRKCDEPLKQ